MPPQPTVELSWEQWRVLEQTHRKSRLTGYEDGPDTDKQPPATSLGIAQETAMCVNDLVASW